MLILLKSLHALPASTSFNVSLLWNCVVAVLGPIYAEAFLETTKLHGVTAPVFVGGVLALHVLASV